MRTYRTLSAVVLSMSLALSAVACGSGMTDAGTAQSAQSVAPVGQGAVGPARAVADALSTIPLRADQRTEIDGMFAAAQTRHQGLAEGHTKFTTALADQVEKGSIDKSALSPLTAEMRAKREQSLKDDRAALVRLHAILTPEQREKFVAALEEGFHKGPGAGFHHGPGGKHDGPRGERPEGAPPPPDGNGGPGAGAHPHGGMFMHGGMHGGMFGFGKDLNLDDDQKAKMKEIFQAEFAAKKGQFQGDMREHMKARKEGLDSFKTPNFQVEKLLPAMPEMGDGFLDVAVKVLPILKPEQRKVAADHLREQAKRPMLHAPPPAAAPAVPATPAAPAAAPKQ